MSKVIPCQFCGGKSGHHETWCPLYEEFPGT